VPGANELLGGRIADAGRTAADESGPDGYLPEKLATQKTSDGFSITGMDSRNQR
jgi:hypothetical protein